jgi:hypothetical protein
MPNITITTAELNSAFITLQKLSQSKWPIKASYWIGRLMTKLTADYQASITARNGLIEELGVNKEGVGFAVEPMIMVDDKAQLNPNWSIFQKREAELMETNIEVNVPQIKLEEFGDVEIEPAALYVLDKFIIGVDEAVS